MGVFSFFLVDFQTDFSVCFADSQTIQIFKGKQTELWKEPPEPLLDEIAELVMKDISSWEGSATELVSLIKVEIQPHVITRKLNILSGRLYAEHGIYYKNNRTHDGRKIRFWKDDTETA